MKKISLTAIAFSALTVMSVLPMTAANAVLIDNFDSGTGLLNTGGTSLTIATDPGDALNNERTLELVSTGLGGIAVTTEGHLDVAAGPTLGTVANVQWTTPAPVDLTEGGTVSGILFEVIAIDVGLVDISLTVANGSSETIALAFGGTGLQFFDFSLFTDQSILQTATFVQLSFDLDPNSDIEIDLIETTNEVPEPSMIAMLGLGLVGLGFARRKRMI